MSLWSATFWNAGQQQLMATFGLGPSTPALEIIAGMHRGVRVALERGDCRIGSTAAADIVLRDPGIVAEHAVLRVARNAVHLLATGGDVQVGEVVVSKGHGYALRPPVTLTLGDAHLRVYVERPAAPPRPRLFAAIVAAGAVLFAIPPLWLVAPWLGITPVGEWTRARAGAGSADPSLPITASIGQPPGAGETAAPEVERAARRLAEHLNAAGIRTLKTSAARGHVAVTGTITKQQAAAWTEAQQWFDETYGGRLIIAGNVLVGDPRAPVLNVQAVYFGERAYLITAEGTRVYKGGFLDNGWTVKDISDEQIILAKDGETFALAYR
jgi:Inner membrane component of T3SS, cytoplasmic domain/Inner membrane component of T3SS, periplasmic domain